jgi:Zn-dependent protease with chaperone function
MGPDPVAVVGQMMRASPYAWAGLIAMLASVGFLGWMVTWLGIWVALRPWRRYRGDSWHEQARLAWAGRRLGRVSLFMVLFPLLTVVGRDGWRVELLPPLVTNFLAFTAALIGQIQATISWGRRLNPAWALTPRPARGAWVFSLSRIGPIALAGFLLLGLGRNRGTVATLAIIAGGSLALGAYFGWGWSSLMRWSGVIRTASDRLQSIATQVADRFGYRPRAVVQVALPMANAFAFIHSGTLGVTDAALTTLDDDELAAVCVHEMAHLTEPRWIRVARLSVWFVIGLGMGLPLAEPLMQKISRADLEVVVLLSGPVLILVSLIVHIRLSRRMEIRADAAVRRFESAHGTYARALERIYAANLVPMMLGTKRQSHPELLDRLVAAGVPPAGRTASRSILPGLARPGNRRDRRQRGTGLPGTPAPPLRARSAGCCALDDRGGGRHVRRGMPAGEGRPRPRRRTARAVILPGGLGARRLASLRPGHARGQARRAGSMCGGSGVLGGGPAPGATSPEAGPGLRL